MFMQNGGKYMSGKHMKAVCLSVVLGLIAVMFILATSLGNKALDEVSPLGAVALLFVAVATIIPVFAAHERHN